MNNYLFIQCFVKFSLWVEFNLLEVIQMGSFMCLIFSQLSMPPTPDAIITVHLTVYSDRV